MKKDRIEMSQRERDRLKVMSAVLSGERTQAEAGRLLKRCVRQVRRLQRRLEIEGDQGVIHRLRGRPSNRQKAPEFRQAVLRAYRETYRDFGPTFVTTAQPGTGFRFAWMADCRTGTDIQNEIAGRIDALDPAFSLYGGDLCNDPSRNSWITEFFIPNEAALIAQVPFFNAVGNHEGWNDMTRAFTQAPDAAGEASGYYSLDYGDLHVLVLNTEIAHNIGSDQWNFAAADLSASTAPWKIVAFHIPAYSSNRQDADMQAMTTEIFEPNGVDMALTGHDHYYEHNLVNGIHHMVIGSAGAPPYVPNPEYPYSVYSESTYCFAIFDMTATTMDMTSYREDGSVIETINLAKDGTSPSAPTNLLADGVSESQIDLAWTAATDPESGIHHYNIYRNTFLVDTTAATSYSDTGLSEATSYTYEVSAVNGAMLEGDKSAPAGGRRWPTPRRRHSIRSRPRRPARWRWSSASRSRRPRQRRSPTTRSTRG